MSGGFSRIKWTSVLHDLRRRLEQFRRLITRCQPRNAWLLRVRARVLAYLLSRYEDDPPAGYDDFPGGDETPPESFSQNARSGFRTVLPKPHKGPLRMPKSSALIRSLLEDIHHLNDFRRRSNHLNGNHC